MEVDKSISSLKRLIADLAQADNLKIWITNAESVLKRIYPDRVFDLDSRLSFFFEGDSTPTHRRELTQLLTGYVKELEELGHPKQVEKNIGQQININQSVNINFIIESLKEELKGKEIKELKDAYEKGKTPEEKKSNVVDKLKKFGADLVSNVLANIITNPSIINGL
jgi:hypothetical protein